MSVIKEIDVTEYDMDLYADLDDQTGFGGQNQIYDEDQQVLYVHEEIYDQVLSLLNKCNELDEDDEDEDDE